MKLTDMTVALEVLVEAIKTDYRDWTEMGAISRARREGSDGEFNATNHRMIADFEKGITIEEGRKYIKIVKDSSVWGFVVKSDGGKFKRGDILKAASWAQPATNRARGNVFDGYTVNWTGPHYL